MISGEIKNFLFHERVTALEVVSSDGGYVMNVSLYIGRCRACFNSMFLVPIELSCSEGPQERYFKRGNVWERM